jgi:hypothetical protein
MSRVIGQPGVVAAASWVVAMATGAVDAQSLGQATFARIESDFFKVRTFDVIYEVALTGFLTAPETDRSGQSGLARIQRPRTMRHRLRMRYEGLRVRLDELPEGKTHSPSDEPIVTRLQEGGVVERIYEPSKRTMYISHAGITLGLKEFDYRCPWLNTFGNFSVPWLLSKRKKVIESSETIDGNKLTVLFTQGGEEESTFRHYSYKLFIDPALTFLPCRSMAYRANPGGFLLHSESVVASWKRLQTGEQVPLSIKTTVYSEIPGTVGEVRCVAELNVDEQLSTWNQPLPANTFDLEPPDGTQIEDQIKNVTYTKGEPDAAKRLNLLAELANKQAPLRSETLIAAAPWWQSTPAIIAYVVLALALVYIIIRRRRLAAE